MDALVLVSGWSGPGVEFNHSPLRTDAHIWNMKPIHFKQCNWGWSDIEHNARKLSRLCEALKKDPNFDKVFVIGHSMGGLLAKYAFHFAEGIDGYVTIGTPHKGVRHAQMAFFSKSARQMAEGSELIKMLSNNFSYCSHSIACEYDAIVPWDRAVDQTSFYELVPHTHVSAIFSKQVARSCFEFLARMR